MKILHLVLVLSISFSACDWEEMDAPPPPGDPIIAPGEPGSTCPQPDSAYCKPGYYMELSRDGTRVFCMPLMGCEQVANPCVRGVPMGDPADLVLCDGVKP